MMSRSFSSSHRSIRKKERNFNPINWDFEIYWLWMVTLIFFFMFSGYGGERGLIRQIRDDVVVLLDSLWWRCRLVWMMRKTKAILTPHV